MDLKEYAQAHHVPVLWEESLEFLIKTLHEYEVKSFLELGTAIGKTALAVYQEGIAVTTIERDPKMIEKAKETFKDTTIQLIEGDALEVELSGQFDCIFIDAAKAQYKRFFEKYSPLLSSSGIIISDNLDFHGLVAHPERTHNRGTKAMVKKLANYKTFLSHLEGWETQFIDLGDGLAITKRSVVY